MFYKWDSPQANPFLFLSVGKFIIPFIFLVLFQTKAVCSEISLQQNFILSNLNEIELIEINQERPLPNLQKFLIKLQRKRKITAAALAFPLPFGIIGLHRLYLGTQPYVPLVYIATVGGAFGILPIVDFAVILGKKDISELMDNKNVFMWVK